LTTDKSETTALMFTLCPAVSAPARGSKVTTAEDFEPPPAPHPPASATVPTNNRNKNVRTISSRSNGEDNFIAFLENGNSNSARHDEAHLADELLINCFAANSCDDGWFRGSCFECEHECVLTTPSPRDRRKLMAA
jgi:hypothetical protein